MSYVEIKKLIATADSSSIDREKGSYAGGPQIHGRVPKIMMKMGTRGPQKSVPCFSLPRSLVPRPIPPSPLYEGPTSAGGGGT